MIVPDDYPEIQRAIDAAKRGDTVEIKAGSYNESLFFKDGITLKAAADGEVTVSNEAKAGPVLTVTDCRSGTISGLTLLQTKLFELKEDEKPRYCVIKLKNSSIKVTTCTVKNGNSSGIRIEGKS